MAVDNNGPDKLSGFPNPFASQKEKLSDNYGMQFAKAMWHSANHDNWNSYNSQRKRIIENREWVRGTQSISHLKSLLNTGGDTAYANFNWNVSNPIHNLAKSFINNTTSRDYDVVVESLDKTSKGELDKKMKEAKFKVAAKKYKKQLQSLGIQAISELEEQSVPDSMEDVDMEFELNYKTEFEEFLETGINYIFNNNNIDEKKDAIAEDAITTSLLGMRVGFDQNRDPFIRWVDFKNVIHSHCKNKDFSDWFYFGEVVNMTIPELQKISGGQFTDKQLFDIAFKYSGANWGNRPWEYGAYYGEQGGFSVQQIQDFKIPVLDFMFRTVDNEKYLIKKNSKGGIFKPKKVRDDYELPPNTTKKELKQTDVEYIYQGYWILETEHLLNYGLMENMVRVPNRNGIYSTKVVCPYVCYAVDVLDSRVKSKVEQMIPLAEFMMLIDLKLQQMVGLTKPTGVAVDVWAMANLKSVSGAAGEEMDISDALKMYNQLGSIFYASQREHGGYVNQKPISQLDNGLPASTMMLIEMYRNARERLYQISGFNPTVDGTSAEKDALVGVEKIRQDMHNNAVKHLTNAYTNVMRRTAHTVGLFLQDALEFHGKEKGYELAIGFERSYNLKEMAGYNYAELGITIQYRPNADEVAYFESNIEKALRAGQIDIAIATRARRVSKTSIKAAERYLERAVERFTQQQQQLALQREQVNHQGQAMAAQQAEQARQQTLQLEYQLKGQYLQLEYQLKQQLSNTDHIENMAQIELKSDNDADLIRVAAEVEQESQPKSRPSQALDKVQVRGRDAKPSLPRVTPRPSDDATQRLNP